MKFAQTTYIYYVDTVGKNTKAIKDYIVNQLKVDKETDQLCMFDENPPVRREDIYLYDVKHHVKHSLLCIML